VTDSNPFRSEIEQIFTDHPRTRFAKVLLGVNRGLTDADMAQEAHADGESIRADSIAAVRRIVLLSLNDELVTAPSEAEEQANVYRELLNYSRSPELNQHIITRLTLLQAIGPNVKLTPLGDVRLGANNAARPEKLEPPCPECNEIHTGECL
jgi:hypothetical protein